MKVVLLSGSNIGTKTRITMDAAKHIIEENYPGNDVTLIDLKDYEVIFSDGRNFLDYTGDTNYVIQQLMDADVIFMGSPIFQASIPASLKNVFDLLPQNAFLYKTVGILITAGSQKHYLIAEQHLKPILGYMKAIIVPNYVFIEEIDFAQGTIANDAITFRIEKLIEDTFILARAYKKIIEEQEESYGF
ncbi:NADPH-dependent FMN reductase [Carnobacterium pleistocenium]|uniref:NADPH-dependent FMN reductase n=1 Tax=Carnobacterium pleistocenium TaxID=181073 RepID=UPI000557964F|nr:NADPH-dependent FMN reductase [Carnobacterium pleistocenium]